MGAVPISLAEEVRGIWSFTSSRGPYSRAAAFLSRSNRSAARCAAIRDAWVRTPSGASARDRSDAVMASELGCDRYRRARGSRAGRRSRFQVASLTDADNTLTKVPGGKRGSRSIGSQERTLALRVLTSGFLGIGERRRAF